MAKFRVPENIGVDEFFTDLVPSQFAEVIADSNMSSLSGKEVALQYTVSDKCYAMKIKDGTQVEVIKGGVANPLMAIALNENDWRDAMTGKLEGVIDRFSDPAQLADTKRLRTLTSTKGKIDINIKREDEEDIPLSIIFNGVQKPYVAIKVGLDDWVSMQNKKVSGTWLFTKGKIKYTGDMVFMLSLQSIL